MNNRKHTRLYIAAGCGGFIILMVLMALFLRPPQEKPKDDDVPARQETVSAADVDYDKLYSGKDAIERPNDYFGDLNDTTNELAKKLEEDRERKTDCDMGNTDGWREPATTDMEYNEKNAWRLGSATFRMYDIFSDSDNFVFSPFGALNYFIAMAPAGDGYPAGNQLGNWTLYGTMDTELSQSILMYGDWYPEFCERLKLQNELRQFCGFWTNKDLSKNAQYILASAGLRYTKETDSSGEELLQDLKSYFTKKEDRVHFDGEYSDSTYYAWTSTFEVSWPEDSECYFVGHDFKAADGSYPATYFFQKNGKLVQNDDVTAMMAGFNYGHYDFIAIMPNNDFSDYVSKFNFWTYNAIWKAMQASDTTVMIPKFAMTREYNVTEKLRAVGLTLPFEETHDFDLISADPDGFGLGTMLHKCYFSLNGRGARTYDTVEAKKAASEAPAGAIWFDRPFIWLVVDHVMGTPVMMGAVTTTEMPQTDTAQP